MWFLKLDCAPRRQWVTAPPRHQGRRQRIYCDFSASCRLARWFLTWKCCWQLHWSSVSLFAPSFLIHHAAANALRVLHIKSFLLSLGQSRVLKLHCIEPAGPLESRASIKHLQTSMDRSSVGKECWSDSEFLFNNVTDKQLRQILNPTCFFVVDVTSFSISCVKLV